MKVHYCFTVRFPQTCGLFATSHDIWFFLNGASNNFSTHIQQNSVSQRWAATTFIFDKERDYHKRDVGYRFRKKVHDFLNKQNHNRLLTLDSWFG